MLLLSFFDLFVYYVPDSIYRDANYYWPLDEINITIKNAQAFKKERKDDNSVPPSRNPDEYWEAKVNKGVRDLKTKQQGRLYNNCVVSQGVVNNGLQTDGKGAWVNFGSFDNTCVSDPSLCPNGFTLSFWLKYQILDDSGLQYFMGTSGNKDGLRGFLIYQDFSYDREDHLAIKVENGSVLWKRSFAVSRNNWTHVTFTWDERDGLEIYANGSYVGGDPNGKTTQPQGKDYTTFTLGRPNNEFVFSKAAYDEIAIWERKLHPREIEAVFQRTAKIGLSPDLEEGKIIRISCFTLKIKHPTIYLNLRTALHLDTSKQQSNSKFHIGTRKIHRRASILQNFGFGVFTFFPGTGFSILIKLTQD